MPKVQYTPAKGLFQSTGTGFSVSGAAIEPSNTECGVYLLHHGAIAVASGTTMEKLNDEGAYIIVADHLQKYVVWFQGSDSDPQASQPALGSSYVYVVVSAVKATAQGSIPALIKTALEAVTDHLLVTDKTSGAFTIEGKSPFAPLVSASVNAINSTLDEVDPGAGDHASFTIPAFGVVVLRRPNNVGAGQKIHAQANNADTYAIPDGTNLGQEIVIIGDIFNGDTVKVSGKTFKSADNSRNATGTITLTGQNNDVTMIRLVWATSSAGTAWAGTGAINVALT